MIDYDETLTDYRLIELTRAADRYKETMGVRNAKRIDSREAENKRSIVASKLEETPIPTKLQADIAVAGDLYKTFEHLFQGVQAVAAEDVDRDELARFWIQAETIYRIEQLKSQASIEDSEDHDRYWGHVAFIAEKGQNEELLAIQEIRQAPPNGITPDLEQLLARAEREIRVRIAKEAKIAFEASRDIWKQQYTGQHIAIFKGEVIDHDPDYDILSKRLDEKWQERRAPFAYVVDLKEREESEGLPVQHDDALDWTPALQKTHTIRTHSAVPVADHTADAWKVDSAPRPLTAPALPELVVELRKMVKYMPLSIIVDGSAHHAAQEFWQSMQGLLAPEDSYWFISEEKDERHPHALDLHNDRDRSFVSVLAADLIFIAAENEKELDERLGKWAQRAWVAIVAAPDATIFAEHKEVGLPHLRFLWEV